MNNKKTSEYISLQKATRYCNYSQEYLSLRARQGKLRAVKLGRNWVTQKKWLEEYITQVEEYNKASYYISLQEATKYCPYSQEYISLRARQGKLQAVKLGRNWVTKKEWLEEYLTTVEEYRLKGKEVEKPRAEKLKEIKKVEKEVLPPENLPVGEFDEREFVPVPPLPVSPFRLPVFRFGLVSGLILILVVAGIVSFKVIRKEISLDTIAGETAQSIKSFAVAVKTEKGLDILKDSLETFKEYSQWVGNKIFALARKLKKIPQNIVQGIRQIAELWRRPEEIVEEPIVPELGEREGMVVIPSTEEDEAIKERIKVAFSDEVKVEPKDKASGIIIPIFREGEGEEYMYVLVPTKN